MPHIRTFLLPAALAALAACAAPGAEQKLAAPQPAPAAAATQGAAPAPKAAVTAAPKPQASEDMMVCRYEREIGSNIAYKVCRPKSQPQMSDDAAREWMREQQSHNVQSAKPGG
ncbi:MAG TPA: hypothetical protein VFP65_13890 [Anaeromyxobacteraceae bacterium]|nr:hypothetical protein [Anaeromyxobacteraceae bacterium]